MKGSRRTARKAAARRTESDCPLEVYLSSSSWAQRAPPILDYPSLSLLSSASGKMQGGIAFFSKERSVPVGRPRRTRRSRWLAGRPRVPRRDTDFRGRRGAHAVVHRLAPSTTLGQGAHLRARAPGVATRRCCETSRRVFPHCPAALPCRLSHDDVDGEDLAATGEIERRLETEVRLARLSLGLEQIKRIDAA